MLAGLLALVLIGDRGERAAAVCAVAVSVLVALNHLAIADGPVIKVRLRDIRRAPNPAVGSRSP